MHARGLILSSQMGVLVRPPRLCIISELCHRGSLYQILHRPSTRLRSRDGDGLRPLPAWPRRLQMMLDAARGCQFLHSHDPCIGKCGYCTFSYCVQNEGDLALRQRDRTVGHLDLKSPNFLVDKNWSVKVADFGMAALKQHFFFQRGNQVGTPQWTAPEVLKGGTAARSDSDDRTLRLGLSVRTFQRDGRSIFLWRGNGLALRVFVYQPVPV
jgi:serine/threonine protein kinase